MAAEDSLLREIDDAVRHDRMMALWKHYRTPVLAVAIALIIGTAGATIWRGQQEKQAGKAMEQFLVGQEKYQAAQFDEAAEAFDLLAINAPRGTTRDMARLWQARALEAASKEKEAQEVLTKLATAPQGNDLIWRDLACLRLVSIGGDHGCLATKDTSPLSGERKLAEAADLWQQGKNKQAATLLKELAADGSLPPSVRERATHYQSAVQDDAAGK